MSNVNGIGSTTGASSHAAKGPTSAAATDVQQFNKAMGGQESSKCGGAKGGAGQTDSSAAGGEGDPLQQIMEMLKQLLETLTQTMQGSDGASAGGKDSGGGKGSEQHAGKQASACAG